MSLDHLGAIEVLQDNCKYYGALENVSQSLSVSLLRNADPNKSG